MESCCIFSARSLASTPWPLAWKFLPRHFEIWANNTEIQWGTNIHNRVYQIQAWTQNDRRSTFLSSSSLLKPKSLRNFMRASSSKFTLEEKKTISKTWTPHWLADWVTLCLRAYQQELPYVLLSVWLGALNLGLAVVVEGARLQRCLQLPGALQEFCFRGNLTHKHLSGDGLGALHWRQLGILKCYQLSTKLKEKRKYVALTKGSSVILTLFSQWWWNILLTAKEAPTGLRTHFGGFLSGGMMVSWAVGWGTCSGGSTCPVPKGSIESNDDEIWGEKIYGIINNHCGSYRSICIALYYVVLSILLNRSNNFNVYIHLTAIKLFHPVYTVCVIYQKTNQKYPSTFVTSL